MSSYEKLIVSRMNDLEILANRMKTALEFYSDIKNWEENEEVYTGDEVVKYSAISVDEGEVAKGALKVYNTFRRQ